MDATTWILSSDSMISIFLAFMIAFCHCSSNV
ncbi:unnamed protein product [Rhizoctonia solani]|uniref:Uncharacterized protein n=1 Tax=Rhizoctonia solani TaxID=456999 RepID=A0A8H3G820_9AGAM|nr:unnamed protein product [Rhizoctonia solani]